MEFNINQIIDKKVQEKTLSLDEITFVVNQFNQGEITNGRMIDFMSAINEKNFSYQETLFLAQAIANTGEKLNISDRVGYVVDKHSVGLISDATTLIFMSVLASLGVKNVKVLADVYSSHRNTLDRFKSFKNFNAKVSTKRLCDIINTVGVGVVEQSTRFAPVDKKMYLLRKQSGIVSIPLIASSILAKKIATGVNAVVYDVKVGEGGLADDKKQAGILATFLVEASKLAGIAAASVITNLDQPLGSCMGAKVEIEETLAVLRNDRALYDAKLIDVARELVVVALCLTGKAKGRTEATNMFEQAVESEKAKEKFKEIITAYGGKYEDFKHSVEDLLGGVAVSYITASDNGYVGDVNLTKFMQGYKTLANNNGVFDKNAGIVLLAREGAKIDYGDKIARVFYSIGSRGYFDSINTFKEAIKVAKVKPSVHSVFYKVII